MEFDVPEGTQSETSFRIRGKGIPSVRGGSRGDEIVKIVITNRIVKNSLKKLFLKNKNDKKIKKEKDK